MFPYYFWPDSHSKSRLEEQRFPCIFSSNTSSDHASAILPRLLCQLEDRSACFDHLDSASVPRKQNARAEHLAPFITSSRLGHCFGGMERAAKVHSEPTTASQHSQLLGDQWAPPAPAPSSRSPTILFQRSRCPTT